MLPDQMIRNWANDKYAHSITNASSRLPRSWKCPTASTPASGRRREMIDNSTTTTASVPSTCPTTNSRPKSVEDHSGSSDITQSTTASDTVTTYRTSPGPLSICIRRATTGSADWSCRADHRFSTDASATQATK